MRENIKAPTRPLGSIRPYAGNPRISAAAVDAVAASIAEFGFLNPIITDADGVVIAGHARLEAARRLGMKEVPCLVAGHLSAEEAAAYRLVDNRTAELSRWDFDALERELAALAEDLDMSAFGFDPAGGQVFRQGEMDAAEVAPERAYLIVLRYGEADHAAISSALASIGEVPEDVFREAVLARVRL